jgi:hypothetical protein
LGAFSQRRARGLVMVAATTYRYRSQRSDEPLRTRLVELARAEAAAMKSASDSCAFIWRRNGMRLSGVSLTLLFPVALVPKLD